MEQIFGSFHFKGLKRRPWFIKFGPRKSEEGQKDKLRLKGQIRAKRVLPIYATNKYDY